jgi:2-amino-4-hydroxy-6-hydroxymethyldihydropteridine diphosphokinase
LGDRLTVLRSAVDELGARGVTVEALSRIYETAPREVEDQPAFLNAACRIRTDLEPPALLALIKGIERDLGRIAGPRFGPRAIDLDILLWEGGQWREPGLEVPHPRLADRRFALVPVLDLDPDMRLNGALLADIEAQLDRADQPVMLYPPRP